MEYKHLFNMKPEYNKNTQGTTKSDNSKIAPPANNWFLMHWVFKIELVFRKARKFLAGYENVLQKAIIFIHRQGLPKSDCFRGKSLSCII